MDRRLKDVKKLNFYIGKLYSSIYIEDGGQLNYIKKALSLIK